MSILSNSTWYNLNCCQNQFQHFSIYYLFPFYHLGLIIAYFDKKKTTLTRRCPSLESISYLVKIRIAY